MHKLYCYVDETGQDTSAQKGRERVFVVSVAAMDKQRDLLEKLCVMYETQSGKGMRKWNSCSRETKVTYLRLVIADKNFKKVLSFTVSHPTDKPDYDLRTIIGIAKAIQYAQPSEKYTSEVFVDGISEAKQKEYANELRKLGIRVRSVRQARDETYPLIRLVDALAGLAREAVEGNEESGLLMRQATRRGIVVEL